MEDDVKVTDAIRPLVIIGADSSDLDWAYSTHHRLEAICRSCAARTDAETGYVHVKHKKGCVVGAVGSPPTQLHTA
jgi:hypothetical protein